MAQVTQRQQKVLDYMKRYQRRTGAWPSMREIAEKCLDSKNANAAMAHIRSLARKGVLVSGGRGKARSWRIVEPKGMPLVQWDQLGWLSEARWTLS